MSQNFKLFLLLGFMAMCAGIPSPNEKEKVVSLNTVERTCPTCEVEFCPKSEKECAHELVRDECGCCKAGVCRLQENEKCLNVAINKNISETDLKKLSVCGEYMKCDLKTFLRAGEIPESVCQCEKTEVSCGKNNVTYSSICLLKEAKTELKHAGPCKSPPQIISEPEVESSWENERLSLNCEAKGFPVPQLHWEFEGFNGLFNILPGDDPSIAVHSRGGPEPLSVSSWVMVESLRPSDAGVYICVAKNSEGVSRSLVSVSVTKRGDSSSA